MSAPDIVEEPSPTPATTRPAAGNAVWERPTAARTPAVVVAALGLAGLLAVGSVWIGPDDTALDDTALDDTALDDTALDDTALDDTALDDTALDDTALDDTALDDTALGGTAGAAAADQPPAAGEGSAPSAGEASTGQASSADPIATAAVGDPVLFDGKSAELDDAALAALDTVIEQLGTAQAVTAVGWTDPSGDRAANTELSLERAVAVADELRRWRPDLVVETVGLGADTSAGPTSDKQRVVVVLDR